MARAMTSQELTYIRRAGQVCQLYLGILQPAVRFQALVNGAPSGGDDRVFQLNYDTGTGTGGLAHMLGYVGTAAYGYDKGFFRLRNDVSGASGQMDIGEISEVQWANNDYLTIVDEFAIAARHLRIDSNLTVYMDWDIAFTDPTNNPHAYPSPVPVLGPSLVPVWLPATPGYVDVDFDASDSWALDGGTITYSWSAAGGSWQTSTTIANPTLRLSVTGQVRVSCEVTRDYGGGVTVSKTGHRYVLVYDSGAMPIQQFRLESCSGSWSGRGWTFRVTLTDPTEAALSNVRDLSWCVLFAKDRYGADAVSIGPVADRENIVCIGWIAGETITWDPEVGQVSFEVRGPVWHMGQMRGFPTGLEDVQDTPAAWTEMQALSFRSGAWSFLEWRSTIMLATDVYMTSDARQIAVFEAARGTLGQQIINQAWSTIRAYPVSNRFGQVYIDVEPQLIPEAQRSSIPTVQTVLTQDLRRPFTVERLQVSRVGMVDLSGVFYAGGSGTPLFSLSPGHVPKRYGAETDRADRLALSSQAQSNELAGLYLGWRNLKYPTVNLPFGSNQRMIDITPAQYLELVIAAGDTIRGITDTVNLLPRTVTYRHSQDNGVMLVDVTAESESQTQPYTTGDVPPSPPSPEPPPPLDGGDWDPWPEQGDGEKWVFGTVGGGVVYTDDMLSGSPRTWYQIAPDSIPDASRIHWLCGDRDRPNTHLAIIDESGVLCVNTDWENDEDWDVVQTPESIAEALGEDAGIMSGSVYRDGHTACGGTGQLGGDFYFYAYPGLEGAKDYDFKMRWYISMNPGDPCIHTGSLANISEYVSGIWQTRGTDTAEYGPAWYEASYTSVSFTTTNPYCRITITKSGLGPGLVKGHVSFIRSGLSCELKQVYCFDGDLYLVAEVNDGGTKTTRVLVSSDWGQTFTPTDLIPGKYATDGSCDYLDTNHFNTLSKESTTSHFGGLVYDEASGRVALVAQSAPDYSTGRSSATQLSGSEWNEMDYTRSGCTPVTPTNLGGAASGAGPGGAVVNKEGHLLIARWLVHEDSGASGNYLVRYDSPDQIVHLTAITSSTFAFQPDMLIPSPVSGEDYYGLDTPGTGTTYVRKDSVSSNLSTIPIDSQGGWSYPTQIGGQTILVLGRGYAAGYLASGGDENLLYLSVNGGTSWTEVGTSMFGDYSVTGITGGFPV